MCIERLRTLSKIFGQFVSRTKIKFGNEWRKLINVSANACEKATERRNDQRKGKGLKVKGSYA